MKKRTNWKQRCLKAETDVEFLLNNLKQLPLDMLPNKIRMEVLTMIIQMKRSK